MRVLSGVQPTGNLHLGNYLGAIRNWARMQDEMPAADAAKGEADSRCFFFLADLHSISEHISPAERLANVPQHDCRAGRLRHRSRAQRAVQSGARARPCRDAMAAQRHRAHGLAQPHDAVQGQGRQEIAKARPSALFTYPVLAGGRCAALSGDACPRRRGPETASRAHPRRRDQVQHRLRRRAVHCARALYPEGNRADHEPARRHGGRCPSPILRTRAGST